MKKALKWIKKETLHVLPVFVFFLVSFYIINLTEITLFRRAGMTPITLIKIVVAAGLIAKIVLVIDNLPFVDLFPKKPLIYNCVWKTVLYWIITFIVRICILFFPFLFDKESFRTEIRNFINAVDWRLFASIQVWYFLLLSLFVTMRELVQVLGANRMRKIFFG